MIERLPSNHFSLQSAEGDFGKLNIQNKGKNTESLPHAIKGEKQEDNRFTKEKVEEIVDRLNGLLQDSPKSLKFEFHEKLNEYYVKIIDEHTKETIREIPPKKMLDYYAAMTEFLGLILDKKI